MVVGIGEVGPTPPNSAFTYDASGLSVSFTNNSNDVNDSIMGNNRKSKRLHKNGSKEEGTVEEFSDPRMYIDGDTDENGEDEDLYDEERGNDENEDVTCDAFCSLDDSKSKDRKTCFSSIHDGEKGCFHKLCYVCE